MHASQSEVYEVFDDETRLRSVRRSSSLSGLDPRHPHFRPRSTLLPHTGKREILDRVADQPWDTPSFCATAIVQLEREVSSVVQGTHRTSKHLSSALQFGKGIPCALRVPTQSSGLQVNVGVSGELRMG